MGQKIRVTAPYVTLKYKDQNGADVVSGFYEGAVVENVDDASAKHHLDSGLAEKTTDTSASSSKASGSKSDKG
jgi:hypothetical protein